MRVLWVGGTHRRHLYYARRIEQAFGLCGALLQEREHMIPESPSSLAPRLRALFDRHFSERQATEDRYFPAEESPHCPTLRIPASELSSAASVEFVTSVQPDVALIFGCGLIREPLYSLLPKMTINLHLGLSPRYRGSATLFWPFYFLEPQFAGSTFHYIVGEPDAGDIIHQVVPSLARGDGIHDVACKTVVASAEAMERILAKVAAGGELERIKQRGTGKNFLSSDFRPEHLRVIYELYDNKIVDRYLEGAIQGRGPKLVIQAGVGDE